MGFKQMGFIKSLGVVNLVPLTFIPKNFLSLKNKKQTKKPDSL